MEEGNGHLGEIQECYQSVQKKKKKSCMTNLIVFYDGMTRWLDERWILSTCTSARL